MIVVDSGVWIDFFNGAPTMATDRLDFALDRDEVAVGDVILTEVLQGFRTDRDHTVARDALTSLPVIDMLGREGALRSADAYRALRRRGITVRKTIDCIIATSCIHAGLPLLFDDRDFQPFVEHLGLRRA